MQRVNNVKLTIAIIVAAMVLIGGLGAVGMYYARQAVANAPGTPVRVEPAVRGELVEIVSAPGQVQPKTKVSISARVAARILKLAFEEGMQVTKGNPNANPPVPPSVLVQLDAKDLEAALNSSKARRDAQAQEIRVARARMAAQDSQVTATRVNLAEAERDLSRQKQLLESNDVSQSIVDTAQSKVDTLKAQLAAGTKGLLADEANLLVMEHNLKAMEADVERATDALTYATITSPIDGTVIRLNAKEGELVVTGTMNNAGTVIMEVADLSQMLLVARVDESSVAGVEVGQKAIARIQAYPNEEFEGTVQTVALSQTDERDGSKYYKTEVLLKTNGRRIYCGLNGDVDIETRRHQDVIKVPSQAVLARPVDDLPPAVRDRPEVEKGKTTTPVVYRYLDGKAVVTPVTIGPSDMTHTIIRSGLSEGDRIIAGPYKVLEPLTNDQSVKDDKEPSTTQPTKK